MLDNNNFNGIVISKSIGKIQVLIKDNAVWCRLGHEILENTPTVGDEVVVQQLNDEEWVLKTILPRRSTLSRKAASPKPGAFPQEQVIAANVDLVVPVFAAAQPETKWNLVDRYLVMAEAAGISTLLCITKTDQLSSMKTHKQAEFMERLAVYRSIGYPIVETSCQDGTGLETLTAALQGKTSILMGKSGVGKTSLMNKLLPGQTLRVAAVNEKLGKGRHTTTTVTAYALNEDSYVIDAPGMRELGLWNVYSETLDSYFPEMKPYLGRCKFRLDCQHEEEPGCAVRQAVLNGQIDPYRYASYMRLKEDEIE